MKTTQEEILLAPSSLSYDWEECQACFYARAVHGERKPPLTMPSIFSKIDSRMKASLTGRELSELVPGAPKGVLGAGGSIKAAPWRALPQHRPIVLRGYPDTLIHFEGDDGSDQVIVGDYKTVVPSAKTAARYKTQLESYAFALEHPAKGNPVKVAGLGLLCYSPDAFSVVAPSDDSPVTGRLDGSFVWIPVDYDEKRYLAFLGKVATALNGPAPAPTEGCLGCEVRSLRALEDKVQALFLAEPLEAAMIRLELFGEVGPPPEPNAWGQIMQLCGTAAQQSRELEQYVTDREMDIAQMRVTKADAISVVKDAVRDQRRNSDIKSELEWVLQLLQTTVSSAPDRLKYVSPAQFAWRLLHEHEDHELVLTSPEAKTLMLYVRTLDEEYTELHVAITSMHIYAIDKVNAAPRASEEKDIWRFIAGYLNLDGCLSFHRPPSIHAPSVGVA